MTSEGLGEMFEDDSADTCAGKFPLMLMGGRAAVKRAQTVSEDPHRREWKFPRNLNDWGYFEYDRVLDLQRVPFYPSIAKMSRVSFSQSLVSIG